MVLWELLGGAGLKVEQEPDWAGAFWFSPGGIQGLVSVSCDTA